MTGFLLHLYGPMQSWADTGFGQLREAGEFPSRAAVLGLVAAAMGIPRADGRLLDLHEALRVHVATVRPGHVRRDFHTVETREGKPRTLTSRDYHHDAHFVALVEGDPAMLAAAEAALHRPVYGTFLGRRSCPPALPLLPEPTEGDPFEALRDAALATARAFPHGDPTWRRGRAADVLTVWLDGHHGRGALPEALAQATSITHGTRRARLIGPRRAYATAPFTRLRLNRPAPATPASGHDAFFHATP